ncbi:C4-dicarboxylate ABC transporter [Roseibium denhamense]|uniref:Tellurite resistance protein n=1 Tax=Roseibium denhamense TaxID=76305 RepID=A0ABY1NYC1_9HYPH|nr:SLAC1 anion channel family protein [Roseibium denhamense]MTI04060.1 C4-dicarboxylate ABC transporter [Roseibium denhamense]SMP20758.1 tellurite resistance protein [Roseibium denhamense]
MTAATPDTQLPDGALTRLEHYPVTFFAIGMGLLGLTLALRGAERAWGVTAPLSEIALAVSCLLLAAIAAGYLAKAIRIPSAVVGEWNHPVRVAFFPAISISTILLATALLPLFPVAAEAIWLIGVSVQGGLSLAVIGSWISHRPFQTPHLSPAWFIPAVGNVLVPVAGAELGYADLSWLFFSAGLLFWLVLLTLVMNRLVFHDPLPGRLVPTLTILIAPPAVAYVAWSHLVPDPGPFGQILLSLGYVFFLIVVTQVQRFHRIPFALSWWALSFPVAALSIASFVHAEHTGSGAYRVLGTGVLALLMAIIILLLVRTAQAIARKEICRPE